MPDFSGSYRNRQKTYMHAMGMGEGDEVYITHAVQSGAGGWGSSWDSNVNKYVNNKVKYISFENSRGIQCESLDGNHYRFLVPYFCLIPVELKAITANYVVLDGEQVELSPFHLKWLQENGLCRE